MCLCDLLVVLVYDFGRHTFHAEDFNLEALSAWVGVFNMREVFLVDLVHVHGETWYSCQYGRLESHSFARAYRELGILYLLRCLTAFHNGRI
jgi:hypothetical protein